MRTRTLAADPRCAAAPGLTWILADGALRHVSTFAGLSPRARPHARCPACGGDVTLKLGRVRAHHAAHRPGEECPASAPESVLHLNVKCHVAAALRDAIGGGARLLVAEPCASGRAADHPTAAGGEDDPAWERWGMPCGEVGVHPWLAGWDRVEVEHALRGEGEARRPDIVLWRGSTVIGAIEVRHHHAVDPGKERSLEALGVPWVEVLADSRLAGDATGWTCDRPLPVLRRAPSGPWRCERHRALREEWRARRVREADVAAVEARRASRLLAARLVDVLYPTGGSTRLLYSIEAVLLRDDTLASHALCRDGQLVREIAAAELDDGAVEAWMDALVREELRRIGASRRATVDSPMGWARGAVAEQLWALFEARDWEGLERTHPRRWRWARAEGRWFRPRDLSGVRWDRPPGATRLEPHPAAGLAPPPRRAPSPPEPGPYDPLAGPTGSPGACVGDTTPALRRRPSGPRRLEPEVLGPCVVDQETLPTVTLYRLAEGPGGRATSRVIVVPVGRPAAEEVERVDRAIVESGRERLWLSHRGRWTRELSHLPWLPVFRRADGEVMVSYRGRTMRLHDVTSGFARGDRRLRPAALMRGNPAERLPY